MKKCNRCFKTKKLNEFRLNASMASGRLHQCKDCVDKKRKEYYLNNILEIRKKRKNLYYANREENILKSAQWQKENKAKRKVVKARWRSKNKELANHLTKDWQARANGANGSYTLEEFNKKLESFSGLCAYCKKEKATTRDHILAVSRGGSNYISNINPACRSCNSQKRDMTISEWKSTSFCRIPQ